MPPEDRQSTTRIGPEPARLNPVSGSVPDGRKSARRIQIIIVVGLIAAVATAVFGRY